MATRKGDLVLFSNGLFLIKAPKLPWYRSHMAFYELKGEAYSSINSSCRSVQFYEASTRFIMEFLKLLGYHSTLNLVAKWRERPQSQGIHILMHCNIWTLINHLKKSFYRKSIIKRKVLPSIILKKLWCNTGTQTLRDLQIEALKKI